MSAEKEAWTYESIIQRAQADPEFRAGLQAAAAVARAQGRGEFPCPSGMVAVYLERLADGEQP